MPCASLGALPALLFPLPLGVPPWRLLRSGGAGLEPENIQDFRAPLSLCGVGCFRSRCENVKRRAPTSKPKLLNPKAQHLAKLERAQVELRAGQTLCGPQRCTPVHGTHHPQAQPLRTCGRRSGAVCTSSCAADQATTRHQPSQPSRGPSNACATLADNAKSGHEAAKTSSVHASTQRGSQPMRASSSSMHVARATTALHQGISWVLHHPPTSTFTVGLSTHSILANMVARDTKSLMPSMDLLMCHAITPSVEGEHCNGQVAAAMARPVYGCNS